MSLALLVGTSAKHVSFVETGRATPSRDLILRLADGLDIPAEKWNQLMLAAGYAPVYNRAGNSRFHAWNSHSSGGTLPSPSGAVPARESVSRLMVVQGSNPVLVHDATFNIVGANDTTMILLRELVVPELLAPEMNALRISLHPTGLARHIVDFPWWRENKLSHLRNQLALTDDKRLWELYEEVSSYEYQGDIAVRRNSEEDGLHRVVPLRLSANGIELSFHGVVTPLVSTADVDLGELNIATFHPVDRKTAAALPP